MRISDWSSDVCSSDLQDLSSGEVTFTETRRVVFGRPAGEVLREQAEAMGARWVLLIASTSLCTRTDAIVGIEAALGRSEERRVGQECVSTCRSRWSRYH